MTKQHTPSPTPCTARDGRRVVMWAEPHDEPKWDVYIAALLAYSLRVVEEPSEQEPDHG